VPPLEAHANGSAGTKSDLEDAFLARVRRAGLEEPLVNVHVIHDIEVDFHWPDRRLCVEVDGGGHTRPRTQHEDARRDARLRAAGYDVLRVGEEVITGARS
jgi:very-short-patch-repair endonuclease